MLLLNGLYCVVMNMFICIFVLECSFTLTVVGGTNKVFVLYECPFFRGFCQRKCVEIKCIMNQHLHKNIIKFFYQFLQFSGCV